MSKSMFQQSLIRAATILQNEIMVGCPVKASIHEIWLAAAAATPNDAWVVDQLLGGVNASKFAKPGEQRALASNGGLPLSSLDKKRATIAYAIFSELTAAVDALEG